ncbi:peptidyl-prolyl cis-trans isomerase FKBP3-like [Actinia tenebrosa]|uniref:peptidylprolyl isomerase n=1 Tax=Actinia tenebrosa TaxID=6105 RepID=A0A6P8ISL5_ACTTE|nr:peptidyl-prolyl cis-trans isomerase FKBP3-like [Actinia tenebrosa]
MAAQEPTRSYTNEQLNSDAVSKKDIINVLQANATFEFLKEMKLNGKLNNVAKTSKKDHLINAYNAMFEKKAFRQSDEPTLEEQLEEQLAKKTAAMAVADEKKKEAAKEAANTEKEEPKYKKIILKQGDKTTYPSKNDKVSCLYTGKLENGTIFDTNCASTARKNRKGEIKPLIFPVGTGKVIRGWDEALLTMSKGEKAELHIESEWAYGRKGLPDHGIPPFSKLIFEVELVNVAD